MVKTHHPDANLSAITKVFPGADGTVTKEKIHEIFEHASLYANRVERCLNLDDFLDFRTTTPFFAAAQGSLSTIPAPVIKIVNINAEASGSGQAD